MSTTVESVSFEGVSEKFNSDLLLTAQSKTWQLVHELASRVRAGWSEAQANQELEEMFRQAGVEKKWHPSKIRFGVNTTKSFRELSVPDVVLKETDIFFIDIGPVFAGHEADCGKTFVLHNNQLLTNEDQLQLLSSHGGSDSISASESKPLSLALSTENPACDLNIDVATLLRMKLANEKLFSLVADKWRTEKVSGGDLYQYARAEAEKLGYQLNLQGANGHRIGDFPHHVFYKGSLQDFTETPQAERWILEIQIRHPKLPYGAFYEDML